MSLVIISHTAQYIISGHTVAMCCHDYSMHMAMNEHAPLSNIMNKIMYKIVSI